MKVIKENLWNRIFRKKEILAQQEEKCRRQHLLDVADGLIHDVENGKTLTEMVTLHKRIWSEGFRNRNIGPDDCGMFRTKDIADMKPEEVFLGNIFGLWTFPIPKWEESRKSKETFGCNGFGIDPHLKVYDVIMEQYKGVLLSNVKCIKRTAQSYVSEYNVLH